MTAELSYLELVERNNELLERLVTALVGWEVPEAYRPAVSGWIHRINLPTGRHSPALGLALQIEVGPDALVVCLDTYDGMRLRRLVVPFDGKPLPV